MSIDSNVTITPYDHIQVKEGYLFGTYMPDHVYGRMNAIANGDGAMPVLPLNGWRGRNLAEAVFGIRDASLLTLGTARAVWADVIKNLPEWDGKNTKYLERFTGIVFIEVVAINPGYGYYITLEQYNGREMKAYF